MRKIVSPTPGACQSQVYSTVIERLQAREPFLWLNPAWKPAAQSLPSLPYGWRHVEDAAARLDRFAPLLADLFPELESAGGMIESPLLSVSRWAAGKLGADAQSAGTFRIKADHQLPVAGSIKARGGIYAVLCFAEKVAMDGGLLKAGGDYRCLREPAVRSLFGQYELSVGSTGNLGLSIGVMGAALGFRVAVHMSVEAKEWKKERLRKRGVRVVEHPSDYTAACAAARQQAAGDLRRHFIDDENSVELLLGYSVAVPRLRKQLQQQGITVDARHPLFLYLPCGVGGAPGGITLAAKLVFGDHAHCFFAEPTEAPCMLYGLLTGRHEAASIGELGIKLQTDADGLAVGRPSGLVGRLVNELVSGCYTVRDGELYKALLELEKDEKISVEPSAAAGCMGPERLLSTPGGQSYLREHDLQKNLSHATHVIWTTGGSLVPAEQQEEFRRKGGSLIAQV
ncbi:MAG: D-serine ammonia-lyase [Verrucomicrobiae bacterium]|nr:D-serine ammonia-lyase [Verrucomicrobiae bacterium]